MIAAQGSYTYAGYDVITLLTRYIAAAVGMYTYTGNAVTTTFFRLWMEAVKNASSFTGNNKASSLWTDGAKNASTFTNESKN